MEVLKSLLMNRYSTIIIAVCGLKVLAKSGSILENPKVHSIVW